MNTRRGRPKKGSGKNKSVLLQVKLEEVEKKTFSTCAKLSGLEMSSWVRERLRRAAIRELEELGKPIPFLEEEI